MFSDLPGSFDEEAIWRDVITKSDLQNKLNQVYQYTSIDSKRCQGGSYDDSCFRRSPEHFQVSNQPKSSISTGHISLYLKILVLESLTQTIQSSLNRFMEISDTLGNYKYASSSFGLEIVSVVAENGKKQDLEVYKNYRYILSQAYKLFLKYEPTNSNKLQLFFLCLAKAVTQIKRENIICLHYFSPFFLRIIENNNQQGNLPLITYLFSKVERDKLETIFSKHLSQANLQILPEYSASQYFDDFCLPKFASEVVYLNKHSGYHQEERLYPQKIDFDDRKQNLISHQIRFCYEVFPEISYNEITMFLLGLLSDFDIVWGYTRAIESKLEDIIRIKHSLKAPIHYTDFCTVLNVTCIKSVLQGNTIDDKLRTNFIQRLAPLKLILDLSPDERDIWFSLLNRNSPFDWVAETLYHINRSIHKQAPISSAERVTRTPDRFHSSCVQNTSNSQDSFRTPEVNRVASGDSTPDIENTVINPRLLFYSPFSNVNLEFHANGSINQIHLDVKEVGPKRPHTPINPRIFMEYEKIAEAKPNPNTPITPMRTPQHHVFEQSDFFVGGADNGADSSSRPFPNVRRSLFGSSSKSFERSSGFRGSPRRSNKDKTTPCLDVSITPTQVPKIGIPKKISSNKDIIDDLDKDIICGLFISRFLLSVHSLSEDDIKIFYRALSYFVEFCNFCRGHSIPINSGIILIICYCDTIYEFTKNKIGVKKFCQSIIESIEGSSFGYGDIAEFLNSNPFRDQFGSYIDKFVEFKSTQYPNGIDEASVLQAYIEKELRYYPF